MNLIITDSETDAQEIPHYIQVHKVFKKSLFLFLLGRAEATDAHELVELAVFLEVVLLRCRPFSTLLTLALLSLKVLQLGFLFLQLLQPFLIVFLLRIEL